MTGRRRLGLIAAAATLLAAAPLSSIFDSWTWLFQSILTVVLIAGAAVAARTLRFPTWAQTVAMIFALALALTWIFPSGKELLIPQPATLTHFADLIRQAGEDTRSYGVPVPDRDGLLFVAVLGIGAVAIVVDLLTAVFRRPALAGLPMLAIYSIPVAVYLDSVPVFPFIIGATGYMWLLVADNVDRVRRFGRRFTGDGRDVDVWEPSPLASAGRRLGMVGVLVAVLLPLAVPTVSGGLLTRLTQSGSGIGLGPGGTGNGQINLFAALSGQLTQNATINIIKVRTNEREPFYLRFGVADVLNADGVGNTAPRGNPMSEGLPDPSTQASSDRANYTEYQAVIEVADGLRQKMLPVYSYPTGVEGLKGNWSYDGGQQVLYSGRATTGDQKYTVTYLRPRYTAAQLRTAEPLDESDALYRQYTAAPADEAVQTKVDELIEDQDTDYDKVRAIYDSFSSENGFKYNLSTQNTGTASDIAAFLENKSGFCQQYAAAMTWMVRAAGIPARVAFGFTRGTALDDNTYQITNRNAHAWTEVYLDGFGWVPFDATPAGNVQGSTRSAWAPDVESPAPEVSSSAGTTAPGAESSAAPGGVERPEQANDGGGTALDEGVVPDDGSWTPLLVVAGIALFLAILLIPAFRRALLRRRRHAVTTGGPAPAVSSTSGVAGDITVTTESVRAREDAHAAWDELIDTMVDFRVPVDPTETPRVTTQRLIRDNLLTDNPAEAAALLGRAEERARYARQPMQGAELTAALRQVRTGLAGTATFRTKARAMLIPPSVLLSWRLTIADQSGRAAEAMSRLRESASRFSPRRLLSRAR
ncbi:transglutaminase TgpA family protein [Actinoplanes sp. CA-015351]|uniref:transglutaminase TgpA family protein n=1 Tax=Actinoplanes sp. CA-015351 TaxID=3239897 RepID=UPI003D96D2D2